MEELRFLGCAYSGEERKRERVNIEQTGSSSVVILQEEREEPSLTLLRFIDHINLIEKKLPLCFLRVFYNRGKFAKGRWPTVVGPSHGVTNVTKGTSALLCSLCANWASGAYGFLRSDGLT